jgi:hypothetical protein
VRDAGIPFSGSLSCGTRSVSRLSVLESNDIERLEKLPPSLHWFSLTELWKPVFVTLGSTRGTRNSSMIPLLHDQSITTGLRKCFDDVTDRLGPLRTVISSWKYGIERPHVSHHSYEVRRSCHLLASHIPMLRTYQIVIWWPSVSVCGATCVRRVHDPSDLTQ